MIWIFVVPWALGCVLSSIVTWLAWIDRSLPTGLDVGLARCFFWPVFVGYLIFRGSTKMFKSTE